MERVIEYTLQAKEDIAYFKKSGQTGILKKIRNLIESVQQNPFEGIGKPEPFKTRSFRMLVTQDQQRTPSGVRSFRSESIHPFCKRALLKRSAFSVKGRFFSLEVHRLLSTIVIGIEVTR